MALYFTLILLSLNLGDTLAHLPPLPKVITPDISQPPLMSAPPPTSGGEFSSSPSHGWGLVSGTPAPAPDSTFPVVPREGSSRNSPSPTGSPAGGDGTPFISSNPAVPLPTGMTDTASIRPLPTPGDGTQVVGVGSNVRIQRGLLVFSTMFSTAAGLVLWM